ncbi:MAG TPA: hypothetical protein VFE51_08920 [Verrucomicrobiae bacterium]|nr:hypothetical protein [Verrucomicrobiae bacterium]
MRLKFDFRSGLLGLCGGLLATLVIAGTNSPAPVGKYQVSGSASFFVIVDTTTGQAWLGNFHDAANTKATDPDFFQAKP